MRVEHNYIGCRFTHLREFQPLRYRRNRIVIRGDKTDIRDCNLLKIDRITRDLRSQRSGQSPRGYIEFLEEKCP